MSKKRHHGEEFEQLRKDEGVSFAKLSKMTGLDQSTIQRWKHQEEFKSVKARMKALLLLGVDPIVFLALQDVKPLHD